jgi:UDP-N-acetylglucosamine 2-epimerase (non-hydrolysing)
MGRLKPTGLHRLAVIFGTRPEAIKLAPVILALQERPGVECLVCVTAQHRQMLDQALDVFGIVPTTDLNLMEPNQTLGGFAALALKKIDSFLDRECPKMVLVQGDTTTVLMAVLASFYRRIPVGHIEAGLRTGNLRCPWPEEANRVLTAQLATVHFAPTNTDRVNLLREGVPAESIIVTGNTVIDALFLVRQRAMHASLEIPGISGELLAVWKDCSVVLVTCHRRDNHGAAFESICESIVELARLFPEVRFVFPVHLNPHIRESAFRILGGCMAHNIHLIEPLAYLPFVALMERATLILTDSGGIQEEGPALGKPVLVMRAATERTEAVQSGAVKLIGTDPRAIVLETSRLLTDPVAYRAMKRARAALGDGQATKRIVEACESFLQENEHKLV